MYTNNRDAYRQTFFNSWQKYLNQQPLTPVEAQLVEIILIHPEYHALLSNADKINQQEYEPEENPFMHMSLHIALREQIRNDRPSGIAAIHQQLNQQMNDPHSTEHIMMTCLAEVLWYAQQNNLMPDEKNYLVQLTALLNKPFHR